jgi:hypothetical protein
MGPYRPLINTNHVLTIKPYPYSARGSNPLHCLERAIAQPVCVTLHEHLIKE